MACSVVQAGVLVVCGPSMYSVEKPICCLRAGLDYFRGALFLDIAASHGWERLQLGLVPSSCSGSMYADIVM